MALSCPFKLNCQPVAFCTARFRSRFSCCFTHAEFTTVKVFKTKSVVWHKLFCVEDRMALNDDSAVLMKHFNLIVLNGNKGRFYVLFSQDFERP